MTPQPTQRIYDEPLHPQYGPVRRMWIIMAQLDMLEAVERHKYPFEPTWDEALADTIAIGVNESTAQRNLLRVILERMKR